MKKLFVHIPKTGGTSILNSIDQSMWNKSHHAGHDPYFILQKQNDLRDVFSFCVVRNPYTRTFSYYNHFKRVNNYECSFIQDLEIKTDHLNKGNYNHIEYEKAYTNPKCVELVKELFSVDFLNFGYDINYE